MQIRIESFQTILDFLMGDMVSDRDESNNDIEGDTNDEPWRCLPWKLQGIITR